jgi:hypothetical protein
MISPGPGTNLNSPRETHPFYENLYNI